MTEEKKTKKQDRNQELAKIQLINAGQLALIGGFSKRQVFRLNSAGKIPSPVRIGGSLRWRLSDIELWMDCECDMVAFRARTGESNAK